MEWHSMSSPICAKSLKTDIHKGLSTAEAKKRLAADGKNTLERRKRKSIAARFFSQLADLTVLILLAASGISFITAVLGDGNYTEPVMILIIVILNAVVGTVQECRAEGAIEALKKLSSPHSRVIRDGKEQTVPSEEIVRGDILCIADGDLICADARLCSSVSLSVEEASLTGESVPSEKDHELILSMDAPLADRSNMVYSSTVVSEGHATAIVTETGMDTRVGRIAELINTEEAPKTPLQKSLAKTGRLLGISALCICAVIFILGLTQNIPPLEMFMIAISLAVAAIPEGLPAVVTIVLALGVRKMALHRAIVRSLPAVETLGSTTVICSDKTGTLTQNKMTVAQLTDAEGYITAHSSSGSHLLSLAALCCSGTVEKTSSGFIASGSPTEKGILLAAASAGQISCELEKKYKRIRELPFNSKRKRMVTVHSLQTGGFRVIVKGAPDVLLPLCSEIRTHSGTSPLKPASAQRIVSLNDRLAGEAMRVIAVAYKDCRSSPADNELEKGLIFCGLIGLTDPVRPQAKPAVQRCKKAGIRPVMITGDHVTTALAVAKELGICTDRQRAMTGNDLDKLSDSELEQRIGSCDVFARVSPEHKVRIVKAFQRRGEVAAMTGDGVNDAPALRCADIGCAMGMSGTDAAKGAADMVLTDDNFSTIVEAVEQGRGIFANIKKTVHFLLSCNIGEILTVLCAFLMRLPAPLLAMQLLWVNLVTDSLPALALGAEPPEKDIMEKAPHHKSGSIFSRSMVRNIIVEGCFIGAISFLAFTIGRIFFDCGQEPVIGRTMTFAVLSLSQLVHSFNLKSEHSVFRTGIGGNVKLTGAFVVGCIMQISVISIPFLAQIFGAAPLSPLQWLITLLLSISPLVLCELEKLFKKDKTLLNEHKTLLPS